MSNISRTILSILEPKIKLKPLSQPDNETKASEDNTTKATPKSIITKDSARWGALQPLIMINTQRFDSDEINYMSLDINGRIPLLHLSISDVNSKFGLSSPLDGDVIMLYLRAPDQENQKSIRIDFDILSIDSNPESKIFGIEGIMKIPGFFNDVCKSFPNGNSFDHLQDVCEAVGLGFASNETATNDKMTRICGFETYEIFVNSTIKSTYKDDNSFFDWYIDPFYYLCLVNLNKQFDLEDKIEDINLSSTRPISGEYAVDKKTEDTKKGKLLLSNQNEVEGWNTFIINWSQKNNSASVWLNNGYKRYSQYLDIKKDSVEYISTFVDPLTTKGAEKDFILPKGKPKDEFYKSQVKYKWLGKQSGSTDGGNVHDNYIFSNLLNFQNIKEIDKLSINVSMDGLNFYIYKYMRIPIVIYESSDKGQDRISKLKKRDKDLGEDKYISKSVGTEFDASRSGTNPLDKPTNETVGSDPRDQIKNEHISGYYIVNGIEYVFTNPGPVKMNLNLIRREWPIPAQNNNN